MADTSYADVVPAGEPDDSTIPVGSVPESDGDGDGDDPVTSLGDIAPGVFKN